MRLFIQTYRDKALDSFIQCLNGDLPQHEGTCGFATDPTLLPKLENQNFCSDNAQRSRNIFGFNMSKIQINTLTSSEHSDESSSHNLICSVDVPINAFKNKFVLNQDQTQSYQFQIVFPTYHRHIIMEQHYDLVRILKRYLNPSVINYIKTEEHIMGLIYSFHFSNYKIRFIQLQVEEITDEQEQENIILGTHNRAHRYARENKMQIIDKCYFPSMNSKISRIIKNCVVCKENIYMNLKFRQLPFHNIQDKLSISIFL